MLQRQGRGFDPLRDHPFAGKPQARSSRVRGGPEVVVDGEVAERRHGGDVEISEIVQVGFCSGKRGPQRQVESVLHEPHLPGTFCRHREPHEGWQIDGVVRF